MDEQVYEVLLGGMAIAFLVISLGIHEAAHGWVALKCGDSTARDLGRITLNPFAHIDLFMTIVLPLMLFLSVGMVFGGAKPVPVNFNNLRHRHRDMALVALAGPISNVLLALLFYAAFHFLTVTIPIWDGGVPGQRGDLGYEVLNLTVYFNLLLAVFNMVPVPPLDGSRVMAYLLPAGGLRESYQRLETFGMLIVILLVFSGGLWPYINRALGATYVWVHEIVTLGGLW